MEEIVLTLSFRILGAVLDDFFSSCVKWPQGGASLLQTLKGSHACQFRKTDPFAIVQITTKKAELNTRT